MGRGVTCYEHIRSDVQQCGGTYSTGQAVRDGNIVTAQTWESLTVKYSAAAGRPNEQLPCAAGSMSRYCQPCSTDHNALRRKAPECAIKRD